MLVTPAHEKELHEELIDWRRSLPDCVKVYTALCPYWLEIDATLLCANTFWTSMIIVQKQFHFQDWPIEHRGHLWAQRMFPNVYRFETSWIQFLKVVVIFQDKQNLIQERDLYALLTQTCLVIKLSNQPKIVFKPLPTYIIILIDL